MLNSLYLLCTGETLGTVLLCDSEKDFKNSDEKPMLQRFQFHAWSLVLFYHLVLIALELIVSLVSFTVGTFWNEDDINFDVVFSDEQVDVGTVLFLRQ